MKNTTRKIISVLTIAIVVCFALTLCACDGPSSTPYKNLNNMLKADYSTISLKVETTVDGETLTSNFTSVENDGAITVTYSCQEFAQFVLDENGNYILPEQYIITKSGSATIIDGNITDIDGDEVSIPITLSTSLDFNFEGTNWIVRINADGEFSGVPTNIKAFMRDNDFEGTNMTVVAHYNNGKYQDLVITYTANGASVKLSYTFA